ncbi:MAG TPA: hypothetical protein VIW24_30810 [Aldersonia sp.]
MSAVRVLPVVGAMLVATSAVSALSVGSAPAAAATVPATGDFATVMGYRPTTVDGVLVKPTGSCSSPVPLPAEFTTACRAHDLGYDELRYAARIGTPLPAAARPDLDDALDARMHAACTTRAELLPRLRCSTMATVAANVVRANTVREGYGSPR